MPPGSIDETAVARLESAFLDKYERLYGKGLALREAGIELVTCRAIGRGRILKPDLPRRPLGSGDVTRAAKGTREVWIPGAAGALAPEEIAIFDGPRLEPGMRLDGPAVIEHADTTIFMYDSTTDTWVERPIRNFISAPTDNGRYWVHPQSPPPGLLV